jgi:glycine cleavage system H protein
MKSIPEEMMFDRHHGWIEMEDDFIGRCGISEQYLKRLDRIEYVEFPDVDTEVKRGEQVALLESNIDYFKYLSPVAGRITEINQNLAIRPELINSDPHGEGWIYKIDVKEPRDFEELIKEDEYLSYIQNSGDI